MLAFIDGFLIIGWAVLLCLVVLAFLRPVAIPRPGPGKPEQELRAEVQRA